MPTDPAAVEPPPHPLPALTTYELVGYRCQLEHAIGTCEREHPASPALASLRTALAAVSAEQDGRAKIAARHA
ncbi:MAG: hypothetical protein ACRDOL_29030 [Streptosporangiaceae bacterium]